MLRTTLRSYQREAVERALPFDGFAFFPEQRTGKCLISLAVVDEHKPDVLVILCPKKALREWARQLKEHLEFDWDCYVRILHFEAACRDKRDRARYRKLYRKWQAEGKSVFTICDEAQGIKKRGSVRSRFVRSIGPYSTWRLALTGTPIAQGQWDAWAIFDFIQRGAFPDTWVDFQDEFLKMGGFKGKKVTGIKKPNKFNWIFHTYCYRITLAEARRAEGKPAARVRRRREMFDLKPSSRRVYEELLENLESEVNGVRVSTPLVLTLVSKLQQLAGGFLIQDIHTPGQRKKKRKIIPVGREKMIRLAQVIAQPKYKTRKLVICCRFKHEIEKISQLLVKVGRTYQIVSGKHEFHGEFHSDVVILQIQSGVAFDLSASNVYIFYSWNHSYIDFEQSRFRIQSFDSDEVHYIFLMARDTVDEDLYRAVVRKESVATLVCDRYRKKRR